MLPDSQSPKCPEGSLDCSAKRQTSKQDAIAVTTHSSPLPANLHPQPTPHYADFVIKPRFISSSRAPWQSSATTGQAPYRSILLIWLIACTSTIVRSWV